MSDFGLELKQARERKGVSLRQIATSTKISMVALEALERDDFSRLPGGIFSRAFVRAYALEVGLDPEVTIRQFLVKLAEVTALGDQAATPVEVSADDRAFLERQRQAARILRVALIALVAIIIVAVFAWNLRQHAALRSADKTPARDEIASDRPATSAPPSAAEVVTSSSSSPVPGVPQPTPPAAALATAALTIQVEASDACWTELIVDGKSAGEVTLKPGEHRSVEGQHDVLLKVGDAGAMKWTINGQAAKAIGGRGDVKQVLVTKENFARFLK
jgi:cytoskeletal protein RodZ